jgi:hypothetical protein
VVNATVVLVGFGLLQNEIDQLKMEKSETEITPEPEPETPIQLDSPETSAPPKEPETSTNPEPESTVEPEPTPEPEPASVNTLDADSPANLTCDIHGLSFVTDGGLRLLVSGDIINTGAQTAYGVELHIETWFPDGRKGLDEFVKLNKEIYFILPAKPVNIAGGESYTLTSRWFSGLVVSVPGMFWLDEWGKEYPYDLISSYEITPIWSDTQ